MAGKKGAEKPAGAATVETSRLKVEIAITPAVDGNDPPERHGRLTIDQATEVANILFRVGRNLLSHPETLMLHNSEGGEVMFHDDLTYAELRILLRRPAP